MELEFLPPSRALSSLVMGFYLFRSGNERIEGVERAGVGHIRFVIEGQGELRFSNGLTFGSQPIMVNGPGTGAIAYRATGPFLSFGLALRPIGWFSIIGMAANKYADRVADGMELFGSEGQALHNLLREQNDLASMAAATEQFLLKRARPVPPDHVRVCDTVTRWLADPDGPNVQALFDLIPLSSRQVVRLVNQYFGAPPKVLERKIRALKAAAAIAQGAQPRTVASVFYDQSHMNREIRHFTGYTPGALVDVKDEILAMSLAISTLGEIQTPEGA